MNQVNDFDFYNQFGMSIAEAVERAKHDDLKYNISFDAAYVENLVCSMYAGYDDQDQKWLMKKSVMMESVQQRKDQMLNLGFYLNTEHVDFQTAEGVIFAEFSVHLINS